MKVIEKSPPKVPEVVFKSGGVYKAPPGATLAASKYWLCVNINLPSAVEQLMLINVKTGRRWNLTLPPSLGWEEVGAELHIL